MSRSRFLGLTALLLATGVAPTGSAEPPAPSADAKDTAALLKAAATAELHGVAVSQPVVNHFDGRLIKDWPKLAKALRDGKGPVARVREFFPERGQKLLARKGILDDLAASPSTDDANNLRGDVAGAFDELIDEPAFYDPDEFPGVVLDDDTKRLTGLGKKRTAYQTAVMNWRLLTAILPGAFPDVPAGFRTVRVQVRTDREVVLVLSCSTACRWDVEVKPGSKVTGVVLCGGSAQEIELFENPVDAPVVYRAGADPHGVRRLKPGDEHFNGYALRDPPGDKRRFEMREKFEAGIKKLTGKGEFTSMQRQGIPKTEPYLIPPKAR